MYINVYMSEVLSMDNIIRQCCFRICLLSLIKKMILEFHFFCIGYSSDQLSVLPVNTALIAHKFVLKKKLYMFWAAHSSLWNLLGNIHST
jgi:hypothetical protein